MVRTQQEKYIKTCINFRKTTKYKCHNIWHVGTLGNIPNYRTKLVALEVQQTKTIFTGWTWWIKECVFISCTIFWRCFCLRCWHSNSGYPWNITPTYKTHYNPMWSSHWCLLSFAFSTHTHASLHTSHRHCWHTLTVHLLHCLFT